MSMSRTRRSLLIRTEEDRSASPVRLRARAAPGRTRSGSPRGHSFGREPRPTSRRSTGRLGRVDAFPARGRAIQRRLLLGGARGLGGALARARPTGADGRRAQGADQAGGGRRQGPRAASAHGVVTHAARAAALFAVGTRPGRPDQLGLDLDEWVAIARRIADAPPDDPGPPDARVTRVFAFRIEPRKMALRSREDARDRVTSLLELCSGPITVASGLLSLRR